MTFVSLSAKPPAGLIPKGLCAEKSGFALTPCPSMAHLFLSCVAAKLVVKKGAVHGGMGWEKDEATFVDWFARLVVFYSSLNAAELQHDIRAVLRCRLTKPGPSCATRPNRPAGTPGP
jgi:hypothetical protein